jgi:hypothetical protein
MISVVSFPRDTDRPRMSGATRARAAEKAFPDATPEERQRLLGRANEVRDMYGFETWTVVDHTANSVTPEAPSQQEVTAAKLDNEK